MRSVSRLLVRISLPFALVASLLIFFGHQWNARVYASRTPLAEIAARYPVGSRARAMAIRREITRRRHPHWRDLTLDEMAVRLKKLTEHIADHIVVHPLDTTSPAGQPMAPFAGDYTTISGPFDGSFLLVRQSDCSLTYNAATYTIANPSYTLSNATPHYEQTLHQLAGLTTTADTFPIGCGSNNGSQTGGGYAGKTSQNLYMFAAQGYSPSTKNNVLYYASVTNSDAFNAVGSDNTNTNIRAVVLGDLNKDGNGDIIELSYGNCSVSVLLGKSDGTFGTSTPYSCNGYGASGAVVADFNGDGHLDVAVATSDGNLTILLGSGDGTLHAGWSGQITSLKGNGDVNLIAMDTRGKGVLDIVATTGDVLLSNGDGTFTAVATKVPFNTIYATSEYGPNLAYGDLDKDGKLDLVYDDGYSIEIFLGNADGTFTTGKRYASIDNIGYVTVTDLDGDGNLDIYTGMAGGAFFLADKFELGEGYALMGNGDGTFQGATANAASYTGTNLADVNGDKSMDLVTAESSPDNTSLSFTTYLGQKDGTFATSGPALTVSTLSVPNVTQGATTYSIDGLNSYAVADINGDGRADLLFIPLNQTDYNQRNILCVAFGNTDGSFAQPSCLELPSLLKNPSTLPNGKPDFDYGLIANNLQVKDLNGDGKPDILYNYQDSDYGANVYTAGFVVQLGNEDGTFGAPEVLQLYSNTAAPPAGQIPQFAQFADLNSDGRPDLVAVVQTFTFLDSTSAVYTYLNNGDGTFKPVTSSMQLGSVYDSVYTTDLNGDGKPDLLFMGDGTNGYASISVYPGNGDGTFGQLITTLEGDSYDTNGLAIGDFDGDGKQDIAVLSYDNYFSGIYFGNGDGTFKTRTDSFGTPIADQKIPLSVTGPAIAYDFDGDGKLDILAGDVLLHAISAPSVATSNATSTSLQVSPTSTAAGQTVMFTSIVTGATTVPTGTVTFFDGAMSLDSETLDATTGKATFSTSTLAQGTHLITAKYSGDSTYAASVSAATALTITGTSTGPSPSFTIALSPASGTVSSSGGVVTTTVTITPANGFNSTTSLACSGLPTNTSCSFSPTSITPNGSPATSTLMIKTAASTAELRPSELEHSGKGRSASLPPQMAALFGSLSLCTLMLLRRRLSAPLRNVLPIVVLCLAALTLSSCSSGKHSTSIPTGPSSISVTATSGSLMQTAIYSLTVQ